MRRVVLGPNLFVLGTSEQIDASYHIRMCSSATTPAEKLDSTSVLS
jgi:hypothetical protein